MTSVKNTSQTKLNDDSKPKPKKHFLKELLGLMLTVKTDNEEAKHNKTGFKNRKGTTISYKKDRKNNSKISGKK